MAFLTKSIRLEILKQCCDKNHCKDLQITSEVLLDSDRWAVDSTTELSEEKNARKGCPPKSLNFYCSLGSDCNNKLEKSSRSKAFKPTLYFGGGFMSSLTVSPCPHPPELIILVLTVNVFHHELLIAMRRLYDQLMHHSFSLLSDEYLHAFYFLALPS